MEEDIFAPKQSASLSAQNFQIIRSLGRGATGEVFLARMLDGGNKVALKILENPEAFDNHTFKRFRDEVAVLRRLRHPNLIEAYEIFDYNGCLAFSMEHVDGYDLGQHLRRRKFSTDEVDATILQVLDALHELHINQILHRDIKLENILLSKTGVIKVGDLGLMKKIDSKGTTRPGLIFGTAQYMAPEYVKKGSYDIRSEIYAVGMVLLELLTGKRRLADVPENKVMETIIKSRFALPEEMLKELPEGYRQIVERALAVNPDDRYQNVVEMRYDIIKNRVQIHRDSSAIMNGENVGPLVEWGSQRKSASRSIWTALTIVLSSIIVYASYNSVNMRPRLTIQPGIYRGMVRFSPGNFDSMRISVSNGEMRFDSQKLDCRGDSVDLANKILRCGSANLRIEFDSSQESRISGFMVRKGKADIIEFKVAKTV